MSVSLPVYVLAALLTFAAYSQTTSGFISGQVTDPQGSVMPNATVTLTQELTRVRQVSETNSEGVFTFPNVLPGMYSVSVEASGFKRLDKKGVVLNAAQKVSVGTLTMQVGNVTESVTVVAYPAHPHAWRFVQFLDPLNDRPPRYASLTGDFGCPSKANRQALAGRDEPSHTLVEIRS